ncbi:hypothetical protein BH11VER1_BH11VER1_02880 [soil metagenome]
MFSDTMTRMKQICDFLLVLLRSGALLLAISMLTVSSSWAATPPATWTTGHKKVLIIPIRFTDQTGPSDNPGPSGILSGWGNIVNGTMTTQISEFMARQSYGKCTFEFTVLPEINMGVSYTVYNAPLNSDSAASKFTRWSDTGSLADDVRAKARQVGVSLGTPALYDTKNYDLDIVATGFIPGQGSYATALTFGKGIYANVFTVLPHEFCHNFGLSHAQGVSRATYNAPLIRNTFYDNKYSNIFDLMGNKDTSVVPLPLDRDAGAYWKYALGWLPIENIVTPVASGTYRLHPFDQGTLELGKSYAMRIVRDPTHTYWFDYRQAITGDDALWSNNGLEVQFGAETYEASAGNTVMFDMTPGSRGLRGAAYSTFHDALLAIGKTYTDSNLHVTPIKKGGTVPESMDVVVNFGPFPGNTAPLLTLLPVNLAANSGVPQTFTASASDPDGDTLAYYWEFDDPDQIAGVKVGGDSPDSRFAVQGTHTWVRNGTYLVRCTVSDMKGHKTTRSSQVTVTGGAPSHLTISGVVKDENGNPIAGAIVNNFNMIAPTKAGDAPFITYDSADFAASGETAADGKYTIQLPYDAPGPHTYYLSVMSEGYAFTRDAGSNAITVYSASYANINFIRTRTNRVISGSVIVAGRGYDPASDGPMTVNAGGQSTQVGAGFWQMSVPDGTLVNITATPDTPNYEVRSYFSNPHLVVNDFNVFYFAVKIPGKMPETGFVTAGATSDDKVGTVQIPVTMKLPSGYTSWLGEQAFEYWIDPSSTAEYGVDYKMSGGHFTYYGGKVPSPYLIPLEIIPTGVPKNKTVVIKLGVSSSIANPGPITTFTYTISNPFQITGITRTNNTINLTWQSTASVSYTIESSPNLLPGSWVSVPPHVNIPGLAGAMSRSVDTGGATSGFYRIKANW